MDRLARINDWLMCQWRLTGDNSRLLESVCEQLRALDVKLDRCWLHNRALRPNYAGVSRLWQKEVPLAVTPLPYGFESTPTYLHSPVRYAVDHRGFHYWRLDQPDRPPFPVLEELRQDGYVGYAITALFFSDGAINAISWAT